ncbi:ABC transporter ATP-binding protein [Streptomyces sp. AC495_CC817]|uniref:ABC transporter ATP-binding protein n=1 Tax=Streptomyces sp. AC495_CC817 TaxID=2823900 RepID=UPI0027E14165|nr:ABC transporter ATP-binding protein [Streptomyces sp. AC495_CC817]
MTASPDDRTEEVADAASAPAKKTPARKAPAKKPPVKRAPAKSAAEKAAATADVVVEPGTVDATKTAAPKRTAAAVRTAAAKNSAARTASGRASGTSRTAAAKKAPATGEGAARPATPKTTAAKNTAAKTTAAKTTPAKATAAKPATAKTTAAKSAASKTVAAKAAAAKAEATKSTARTAAARAGSAKTAAARTAAARTAAAKAAAAKAKAAEDAAAEPADEAVDQVAETVEPRVSSQPTAVVEESAATVPAALDVDTEDAAAEDAAEAVVEGETSDAPAVDAPAVDTPAGTPAVDADDAVVGDPDAASDPDETDAAVSGSSAAGASEAIRIRGLVKSFGDHTAVNGIDLTVPAGSFYGIVGPNGAGKTTTLSIVAGLLRSDAGSVVICGVDQADDALAAKRMMGVLPDRLRTFDRLTGRQLLFYYGLLRGLAADVIEKRVGDLARAFDLGDALSRVVSDYSAGMTKKIMLAGAMIHSPRVLVLDEPFEAVDPVSSAVILDILRAYVSHGGTVILSSHGMDLVERVCSRVAIIVGGEVLAEGTIDEVRAGQSLEARFVELSGGIGEVEGLEWLHTFSD